MSHDDAPQRTGLAPRGSFRTPPPRPDPRLAWVVIVAALVVASVAVAWVLGLGGSPPHGAVTSPSSSATPAPTASLRTTAPPPSPAPPSTPSPAPPSAASPAPGSSLPTPEPQSALTIDFPSDGEVVRTPVINVVGVAPPGATITRDIPLWFDDHTTARPDGIWMLSVPLAQGENELAFRIGDDRSTEIRLFVTYRAPG